METAQFIHEVRTRAGLDHDREARRAVTATLEILGQHLPDNDREVICHRLSAELAQFLRRRRYDGDVEADAFYELVSEVEGVAVGFALEHATVVCQVLAEVVGPEGRRHLTLNAPPSLSRLFEPRQSPTLPPPHVHEHLVPTGEGHTLASGRPGSYTPISVAHGTAHRESVVESDNPHGDVKLSSAEGVAAERFHETLANGRPGAKQSLSDAKG